MAGAIGLAGFLERLSWSPERLAREINRLCGEGTVSAKAPYHWLRGTYPRREIPEAVAQVLSQHLKETVDIASVWPRSRPDGTARVAAAPREPGLTPLVQDSCSSARLVQYASETNADDSTLEQLRRELSSISSSCLHVPPSSLVYRAVMLRDRLGRLLQGRQKPAQRRVLLALSAKSCALLAWMSDDLGDGNAAYNQAMAAWDLADLADDNEARRWVRVVQARQSYWSRNFVESAERAVDGTTWPSRDGLDVFLTLMAARSWAAAGLADRALEALREWERAGEGDAVGGRTGLFSLQCDRQRYLAGSTLLTLGEPERALRELTASLEWAGRLPAGQSFYAVDALARVGLMRARLRLDDPDGAREVLEPVFALEPEKLINMVVLTLREAAAELRRDAAGGNGRVTPKNRDEPGRRARTATVHEIADRIDDFLGSVLEVSRPAHLEG
ncbi:hypothetical protein ACH4SP_34665 [Streptomyces sp. NPDC021093]|uniref:hypothetical protein n=1 Tax=Streptomyces sp. NPDC021093 TaxID=3365112 RepID=UPI0037AC73EC